MTHRDAWRPITHRRRALLKPLGEGQYLGVEASLPSAKRRALVALRSEALEEPATEVAG